MYTSLLNRFIITDVISSGQVTNSIRMRKNRIACFDLMHNVFYFYIERFILFVFHLIQRFIGCILSRKTVSMACTKSVLILSPFVLESILFLLAPIRVMKLSQLFFV